MKPKEILKLKMDPNTNDANASSVKEYLKMLLTVLWEEGEGFSGKRPFGNSGWEYELYKPLVEHGAVEGSLDLDGYVQFVNKERADELIFEAIEML